MADQRFRATAAADQTSASQHLKVALSYLEEAENAFFEKRKLTYEDAPELFSKITKAAEHIAAARAKDANQKLVTEDKEHGTLTWTQDELAAAILHREGRIALLVHDSAQYKVDSDQALIRARIAFSKAIKFASNRELYYLDLGEVYRVAQNKPEALKAAQAARQLNPNSPEALKLLDDIAKIPDKIEPQNPQPIREPLRISPSVIMFIAGLVSFFSAVAFLENGLVGPAQSKSENFVALLIFVGLTLIGISIWLWWKQLMARWEYDPYSDPNSYEYYVSKKDDTQYKQSLNQIYEDRYRRERGMN